MCLADPARRVLVRLGLEVAYMVRAQGRSPPFGTGAKGKHTPTGCDLHFARAFAEEKRGLRHARKQKEG